MGSSTAVPAVATAAASQASGPENRLSTAVPAAMSTATVIMSDRAWLLRQRTGRFQGPTNDRL